MYGTYVGKRTIVRYIRRKEDKHKAHSTLVGKEHKKYKCKKKHSLRVGWRNLVRVSLIFAIIVSFMLFTVFPLIYVLYFKEFLIHDSHGFMILKNN